MYNYFLKSWVLIIYVKEGKKQDNLGTFLVINYIFMEQMSTSFQSSFMQACPYMTYDTPAVHVILS